MRIYYYEMNYFRGLAIFAMVWSHVAIITSERLNLNFTTSWNHITNMAHMCLWPGSSWFFVFISGFLYYVIFFKNNYTYKKFIIDKLKKVFLPYCIFLIPHCYQIIIYSDQKTFSSDYIINLLYSYWYIVFIMGMFIITPIFNLFIKTGKKNQIYFFILSIFVCIISGRNPYNLLINIINFSCAYLLGIIIAINYDKFKKINFDLKLSFFYISILIIGIMTACGISFWENSFDERWQFKFFSDPKQNIPVKLLFCIVYLWFFLWLHKQHNLISTILKKFFSTMAKYSFTIYFSHYLINDYMAYKNFGIPKFFYQYSYWGVQFYFFILTIFICYLIIFLSYYPKKFLGKYSRYIIAC